MSIECGKTAKIMEDKDNDLVREFFAAVRSRPCGAVISLIEANPGLICSVEDADSGDTALHVAVKACRSGDVYMANMYGMLMAQQTKIRILQDKTEFEKAYHDP